MTPSTTWHRDPEHAVIMPKADPVKTLEAGIAGTAQGRAAHPGTPPLLPSNRAPPEKCHQQNTDCLTDRSHA